MMLLCSYLFTYCCFFSRPSIRCTSWYVLIVCFVLFFFLSSPQQQLPGGNFLFFCFFQLVSAVRWQTPVSVTGRQRSSFSHFSPWRCLLTIFSHNIYFFLKKTSSSIFHFHTTFWAFIFLSHRACLATGKTEQSSHLVGLALGTLHGQYLSLCESPWPASFFHIRFTVCSQTLI